LKKMYELVFPFRKPIMGGGGEKRTYKSGGREAALKNIQRFLGGSIGNVGRQNGKKRR